MLYQIAASKREPLEQLTSLLTENKIRAAIDKTFPMEQAVEAHRYIESGKKAEHVVLTVANEG